MVQLFTWEFPKLRMRKGAEPAGWICRDRGEAPLQALHAHLYLSHALVAPEAGLAGPERGQKGTGWEWD